MKILEPFPLEQSTFTRLGSLFSRKRGHSVPLKAAALVLLTILVLFLRRPGQFSNPYLWIEDGTLTLRSFADHGVYILLEPVSGFHIFASKLLAFVAFRLSALHAPAIEEALAVVGTCGVILAIAFSPIHLRFPAFCAIATLLVPTDAEVFTTSAYFFWWVGYLLILVPLWRPEKQALRFSFLLFGGVSCPLISSIALVQIVRAALERTRTEIAAAVVATALAALQIGTLLSYHATNNASPLTVQTVISAVDKFTGYFILSSFSSGNTKFYVASSAICVVLLTITWFLRKKLDRYFLLLAMSYALICGSVIWRSPIEVIHPLMAGERYFFYPFGLLMWISIWLAALSPAVVGMAFVATLGLSLSLLGGRFQFGQDHSNWEETLMTCARSDGADVNDIPIFYYNGKTHPDWHLKLTGDQCRHLISGSIFQSTPPL
jgi:hypothetical protein